MRKLPIILGVASAGVAGGMTYSGYEAVQAVNQPIVETTLELRTDCTPQQIKQLGGSACTVRIVQDGNITRIDHLPQITEQSSNPQGEQPAAHASAYRQEPQPTMADGQPSHR